MAEPQLSVRSSKARDLAHRLARQGPAAAFYARVSDEYGSDIDLEALVRETRMPNPGPEL